MDRPPDQPLTIEEAKARLRESGEAAGMAALLRRHPVSTLLLVFIVGVVVAKAGVARTLLAGSAWYRLLGGARLTERLLSGNSNTRRKRPAGYLETPASSRRRPNGDYGKDDA